MNLSSVLSVRPRLVALAFAAVVAFVVGAVVAADADAAGSGGIGLEPASSGDGDRRATDKNSAKYNRLWDRVSRRDKRWARRTARCESGGDPDAIGGGGRYRGAFQFMRSTWKRSPKSPGGDPIDYPYVTQAVVAVALKKRDGAGHWPNCG
jgi:soluble lytic murein transglycosylase-like protein